MYRSFDYLSQYKDEILTSLWNNTKDSYNRDTSISYYDTTNYYFEISYNDEDEFKWDYLWIKMQSPCIMIYSLVMSQKNYK